MTAMATRQLRYPKLRPRIPVLRRSDGELQIGVDSESALVFTEPRLSPVLLALDGAHHVHAVREAGMAQGLQVQEVDEVLRVLGEARMLLEGGRGLRSPDALHGRSVRLIGAGRLGQSIARLLAQSRVGHLWIIDDERCEPGLYPRHSAFTTRAEALRAMVSEESKTIVRTATDWAQPTHLPLDITILASETVEADRLIAADLLRADQPHLVVRSAGEAVIVGPLVVPGRTACLRCTDLTRRDADPAWPALLDQLTRLRLPATYVLTGWAACQAATQALAFLQGGTPEASGATIELSERDLVTRWRTWAAHPACGCHWFSARQWGP
jgi:hypothetical protein